MAFQKGGWSTAPFPHRVTGTGPPHTVATQHPHTLSVPSRNRSREGTEGTKRSVISASVMSGQAHWGETREGEDKANNKNEWADWDGALRGLPADSPTR